MHSRLSETLTTTPDQHLPTTLFSVVYHNTCPSAQRPVPESTEASYFPTLASAFGRRFLFYKFITILYIYCGVSAIG